MSVNYQNQITNLYNQDLLPKSHVEYLWSIKDINPRVIYDIGSCVLHWTRKAEKVWPNANIFCFDAIEELRYLYKNNRYLCHVLSDRDGEERDFYKSLFYVGGQSLYQENAEINSLAATFFNDSSRIRVTTYTLDTVVSTYNLPLPDLIKIDVQGAEMDIIRGGIKTIRSCNDIILELQDIDFNKGAPKSSEVITYMDSIGYECVKKKFSENKYDADYHFKRKL